MARDIRFEKYKMYYTSFFRDSNHRIEKQKYGTILTFHVNTKLKLGCYEIAGCIFQGIISFLFGIRIAGGQWQIPDNSRPIYPTLTASLPVLRTTQRSIFSIFYSISSMARTPQNFLMYGPLDRDNLCTWQTAAAGICLCRSTVWSVT